MSVRFEDFTFTYIGQKKAALKDVNLKIEGGKVGIIGPTGSGKTTLLMALNGLVPHTDVGDQKGDVVVMGLNTRDHTVSEMARHVGLVMENPVTQLFSLTVIDDVAFGPSNLGLPLDEIKKRLEFALEAARLKGFEKRDPNDLSGGEQQSLAIADILAMEPKILAMDEPICMLDPMGKSRVLSLIKRLADEGKVTIIISESGADIDDVVGHMDRVIVLHHGEIVLDDSPADALQSDLFEEAGIGYPQVTELFLRLRDKKPDIPIPVTLEEATEYIREEFERKKVKVSEVIQARPKREVHVQPEAEPIIKVRNLHHVYPPDIEALRGVSLDIYEGEIVGLIGQNGSGKTTLAYHLVGLLKPTNPDAKVIVDGIDVTKEPISKTIEHINYVFQNPDSQLFAEKVLDEIAYGPKNLELPEEEIERRVAEAMKLFNIEGYGSSYTINLSRDLKTFVAISSILTMKPKILLIDEPTTGLDVKGVNKVMEVLLNLRNTGHTVIIISHNMKLIAKYCDSVVVLKDGNVLTAGSAREVFSNTDVVKKANILPPLITQLAQDLKEFPPDILTVDEMYNTLIRVFS